MKSDSLKKGTLKGYHRVWALCYDYHAELDPPIYPPYSKYTMVNYLEELWRQQVGKSTPKLVIEAVNWFHEVNNWPTPCNGQDGKLVQRAKRAVQTVLPKKGASARRPLTRSEKIILINEARSRIKVAGDHWDRNTTLIAYTCACGGRIDDIIHLTEEDLKWVIKPVLGVKAYYISSKTDPISRGSWQPEFSYQDVNDENDGVILLLKYIRCTMKAEKRIDASNSFIFQGFNSKLNISGGTMYSIIKKLSLDCGIDPDLIGTHSFRKTCGTDLYGITNDIAAVGRKLGHKKNSESTKFYIGPLMKNKK